MVLTFVPDTERPEWGTFEMYRKDIEKNNMFAKVENIAGLPSWWSLSVAELNVKIGRAHV
jgi:hypothetical protein